MAVNMADIARVAGVGKATVSLALRNDTRLREETRLHIQGVAERLGYTPNAVVANLMAQLRASKNPKYQSTLGLLNASNHPDALRTNFTFRTWTEGLAAHSAELGYGLDEFWLRDPAVDPARLRQILRARNIRGVVIAGVLEHREIPARFDLLWRDLACVVVGVRPERPALHFACNDQYSTALHAAEELQRLGYRRPGLVIDPAIEENIDHRFTAGFYSGPPRFEERLPGWDFHTEQKTGFFQWLKRHHPDVVVTTHPEIRSWLKEHGLACPKDIGLIHLDLTREVEGWSGMKQSNHLVGAFAVDLLIGQLHRNEKGIPECPRCMMVESLWVPGSTVRRSAEEKVPGRKKKKTA
ncbi:MAG: LacI family DNA-binding transcriptional regulator [Candidatus Methylacidiphilales bacterium]|nr:LacI family DNA-binding transcriptional regulator [Candidatus Methylacidiphilales bacterium]